MKTLNLTKSIGRSRVRRGFILISFVIACFALAPAPKAFGSLRRRMAAILGTIRLRELQRFSA
jgi:hypothetical protein